MKFIPKTDEEIKAESSFPIWPPGEYDFEIRAAEDTFSKAGNDMIKLTVDIYNDEGGKQTVFDYLLESVGYKLKHCAQACGLGSEYERGELEAIEMQGKTGRCKVGIQKDKTKQYPDKNGISDYIVEKTTAALPNKKLATADLDDEIPF